MSLALNKLKKRSVCESEAKPKKKINRFDGLTEEEVQKYTLEDILEPNLDVVFVGINPSLMAAHRGRYYAGPGNHFYKLLHASGLVPRFVSFEEDKKLLDYKIGLTNIVARATRSSADLKKTEIKDGSGVVREKLKIFEPKIAVFNGKCIYEVFAEKMSKSEFNFGLQPERVGKTAIWVVPSSSARCAHFPRMDDKLHFYQALKKYLSFVKGEISEVNLSEFRFEGKCKQKVASTSKMWRRKNVSAFVYGGRVANKETVCLDTSEENLSTVRNAEFIVTEILAGSDDERDPENVTSDSTSENTTSQESTEDHGTTLSSPKASKVGRNNSKRTRNLAPMNKIHPRALKARDNDTSMDFMDLIKKRLSEKRDLSESQSIPSAASSEPTKSSKKLKYANLKLNSIRKAPDGSKDTSDTCPVSKKEDDKVFEDQLPSPSMMEELPHANVYMYY